MKKIYMFLIVLLAKYACFAYDAVINGIYYNLNTNRREATVTYRNETNYNSYRGEVRIPATVTYKGVKYEVTSIEDRAFRGCSDLRTLIIEDYDKSMKIGNNYDGMSIVESGKGMFYDCPLDSVYFGRYLSYPTYSHKGYSPFAFNKTLRSVVGRSLNSHLFYGCSGLKSIITTNSPIEIPSYCFYGCESLSEITIPNSVKSIEHSAFRGCSELKHVKIGPNLKTIGENAFDGCSQLQDLILPPSLETLSNYSFSNCVSISTLEIPNNVTFIGWNAFSGCRGLISINIPENVTCIENSTFRDCSNLTSITIPESVTSIKNGAFDGCTKLENLVIKNSTADLNLGYNISNKAGLFYDCPLDSVYVGRNITYSIEKEYGYSPFASNKTLRSVVCGLEMDSMEPYLFYNCSGIKSIKISESTEKIADYAFSGCSSLPEITIPISVKSIGNCTFNGCTRLKYLIIEDSDAPLSLGYNTRSTSSGIIGRGLFYDCPLDSVYISRKHTYQTGSNYGYSPYANNKHIKSFSSNLDELSNYIFYGCTGLIEITIPTSVKSISDYAFANCTGITGVHFGKDVQSIGNRAFEGCSDLRNLDLSFVKNIGNGAFMSCTKLSEVLFNPLTTTIQDYAFNHCTALTSITIPNSVISISNYAFSGCSSLTSVTIPNSVTSIGSNAFYNCM